MELLNLCSDIHVGIYFYIKQKPYVFISISYWIISLSLKPKHEGNALFHHAVFSFNQFHCPLEYSGYSHINTFLFENISVNIGMTVPYSHLLYLINGSIISGAKRCLQINDRQLYFCRWRVTSCRSGAIIAVEWMRSHSVVPVAVVVRFMTLEQLGVNYLPSALQWDTDTWSHVLMPLIMACLPSVGADCSG